MTNNEANPESQPSAAQVLAAGEGLLVAFGVHNLDPLSRPEAYAQTLKELSPRHRGGRTLVRLELEQVHTEWPAEVTMAVDDLALRFGMLKPETPLVGGFDLIAAMGGARQSNLDRTAYASEAIGRGQASGKLIVAGCTRKLIPGEAKAGKVPGASTEASLVRDAARMFGVESFIVDNPKAHVGTLVDAIIRNYGLTEGSKLALSTTQIYQLFFSLDARRAALPYGMETTVAGCPSDPELISKRTPATYIAEVIRTLQAAHKLLLTENGISLGNG